MEILVAITNHGTKNNRYLEKLLAEFSSMPFDIDIVVLSNIPKDLGADIEVIVKVPGRDPWSLPYTHKKLFAERVEKYDLFIYTEDDTLITERNIHAFFDVTKVLPENEIAGFMRYEVSPDGTISYEGIHSHFHWEPDSFKSYGEYSFAYFTNEHSASYILTRKQLQKIIRSGGYLVEPYEGRYDMLCSAATDPYTSCGLKKLICISNLEDFSLHHLPNTYAGVWGTERSLVNVQLDALKEIGTGKKSSKKLFNVTTLLTHALWDKRYYEPCTQEILEIIPQETRTLLSVGCGSGATEAQLVKRGIRVVVIPLDLVIGACAEKNGIKIVSPNFEEAKQELGDMKFDCLLFQEILHHLPNPVQVLSDFVKLLSDNGCVIISVPNFKHVSIYGKRLFGKKVFRDFKCIGNYEKSRLHFVTSRKIKVWALQARLKPGMVNKHNHYITTSGKIEKWLWQNRLNKIPIFGSLLEISISSFLKLVDEVSASKIILFATKQDNYNLK